MDFSVYMIQSAVSTTSTSQPSLPSNLPYLPTSHLTLILQTGKNLDRPCPTANSVHRIQPAVQTNQSND